MTKHTHISKRWPLIAAIAVALASGGTAVARPAAPTGPQPAKPQFVQPSTVSAACQRDPQLKAGCTVVIRFFRAIATKRFAYACSLLGNELLNETGGQGCAQLLGNNWYEPQRWGILQARITAGRVDVLVSLDQPEFDHVRERWWLASVGIERGVLKILETKLRK